MCQQLVNLPHKMPGDALLTLQKVEVQCDMQNALQSLSVYGASQVQLSASKLVASLPSANEKAQNWKKSQMPARPSRVRHC